MYSQCGKGKAGLLFKLANSAANQDFEEWHSNS